MREYRFELPSYGGPNSGKTLWIHSGTLVSFYIDEGGKFHRYELDVDRRQLNYKPM